jgi:hypothetical protein
VGSMAVHTHPAVPVQIGEAAAGQGLEEVVDLGPGVGAVPTIPQTHHALGLGVVVQRELTKKKQTTTTTRRRACADVLGGARNCGGVATMTAGQCALTADTQKRVCKHPVVCSVLPCPTARRRTPLNACSPPLPSPSWTGCKSRRVPRPPPHPATLQHTESHRAGLAQLAAKPTP